MRLLQGALLIMFVDTSLHRSQIIAENLVMSTEEYLTKLKKYWEQNSTNVLQNGVTLLQDHTWREGTTLTTYAVLLS